MLVESFLSTNCSACTTVKYILAIRCLSFCGFLLSVWKETTSFAKYVLCSELSPSRQYCAQWFMLWHIAYLVCAPCVWKGFLPTLRLGFFGGGAFWFPVTVLWILGFLVILLIRCLLITMLIVVGVESRCYLISIIYSIQDLVILIVFIIVIDAVVLVTSCFVFIVVLVVSVSVSVGLSGIGRLWFNTHCIEFIGWYFCTVQKYLLLF